MNDDDDDDGHSHSSLLGRSTTGETRNRRRRRIRGEATDIRKLEREKSAFYFEAACSQREFP